MIRKGLTKKEKKQASEEARIFLKKNIKENEIIYYVVTHVSQSGMYRHIKFFYHAIFAYLKYFFFDLKA